MKSATLLLPAAFRALASTEVTELAGVLIDPVTRNVIVTDGDAIAALPIPKEADFPRALFLPTGEDDVELAFNANCVVLGDEGPIDDATSTIDYAQMRALASRPPVYRLTLNAASLAKLAAALGSDVVVIGLPADATLPLDVRPFNRSMLDPKAPRGFVMPHEENDGLLIDPEPAVPIAATPAKVDNSAKTARLEIHDKTKALIVHFDGKPSKEVRGIMKDPGLGFRWSGGGTRRGIPEGVWYGPDNPYTRQRLSELPGVTISEPAAAA